MLLESSTLVLTINNNRVGFFGVRHASQMLSQMERNIDKLDDEQLAATAYVWRQRAAAGERHAYEIWVRMERELLSRLGPTPSQNMPLVNIFPVNHAWWKFWK